MPQSVSSLLTSAASRRNKIREQEDSMVAFEYSLSAKTYDDFANYSRYLDNRSQETQDDPSQLLTYQKAIVGARKGYVSNEIQRTNIDIIEGRADNNTKYEKMKDLFYQALDNGDYDLAQSLNLQLDNLSVKIQQEQIASQEAQQRAYSSAAAAGAKSMTDLMNKLEKGVDDITLASGEKVTPLSVVARDLEDNKGDQYTWQAASQTLQAMRELLIDQYEGAGSQDEIDKLEQKYGAGLENIDEVLNFKIGGKNLTAQQVSVAAENEAINNPIYSLKATRNEATGKNEFKLVENNTERLEYTRQIDEQGNEYYAPTTVRTTADNLFFGNSDQGRGLNTQITDNGEIIGGGIDGDTKNGNINLGSGQVKREDSQTIGNRLGEFGITAKQNGTTLKITLPGDRTEREATIQPDGSIRYFKDDGQLAEVGITDRNLGSDTAPLMAKAGQERIVAADEGSDFGQASAFGGQISKASEQGRNYLRDITTVNDLKPNDLRTAKLTGMGAPVLGGNIRTGNNFSGSGSPVVSNLLQGGSFTQGNIQKERAAAIQIQAQQEAAQRAALVASPTFNLNQTPVSQFASNGVLKKQLKVAPVVPTQRIASVSVAKPTQKITSVGVAKPRGRVVVR